MNALTPDKPLEPPSFGEQMYQERPARVLLAPSGSGKSHFMNLWRSSFPFAVDVDTLPVAQSIYRAVAEAYGDKWWEVPEACAVKDEAWNSVFKTDPMAKGHIYLTSELAFALQGPRSNTVLYMPTYESHTLYMTSRLNNGNGRQPVKFGQDLTDLRTWYFNLAQHLGLFIYSDINDAFQELNK